TVAERTIRGQLRRAELHREALAAEPKAYGRFEALCGYPHNASNRPNTGAASAVVRAVKPVRTNIRCSVRPSGAQPACTRRIRWTCAAVRAGFSFFSATASSSTSGGVRG